MRRLIGLIGLLMIGCHAATPRQDDLHFTNQPAVTIDSPESWAIIAKTLGHTGTYARGVYTVTVTRDDLDVSNDIGDIPSAAGMDTSLYFFKCPCGRLSVAGRFVVAEYEANDVMSELQTDGMIKIASLSPMFLHEKPRLLVIQIQGEGDAESLAKRIKSALDYTGDSRFAPQTMPSP